MHDLIRELAHSIRSLARKPAFAVVVVLTLALGIGSSTAVFSVVKGVLLKPLPFREGERIVWILGTSQSDDSVPASAPDFVDLRQQNKVFDSCAIFTPAVFVFGEDPQRVSGLAVSTGFFEVFGVGPLLGRTFLPSEEHGDARYRVVILSHDLWRRRFAADPAIIGKTIELDGKRPVVVGVMPEWFGALPTRESSHHLYELWVPLNLDQKNFQLRSFHVFSMVARLRRGVGMEQAKTEMNAIARYLGETYPNTNRGRSLRLERARRAIVGDVEPLLLPLLVAVAIVLLIACSNVANLLLARAIGREAEAAVRMALGARWWQVFRPLLCEALLLSLLAGIIGFLLGAWGVKLLIALSPDQIGRLHEVGVDRNVACFALLVSLLSGLLVAAIPTFRTSRTQLRKSLLGGGVRGKGESSGRRLSGGLLVIEVALGVLLMTTALAMLKNLQRLLRVDTGFDADRVVTAWVDRFEPEILQRVISLPGVDGAGAVSVVPIGSPRSVSYQFPFSVEGKSDQELGDHNYAFLREATPGYFRAMRIPLLRGALFSSSDTRDVAVISQTMADWIWPGADPIGKRIAVNSARPFQARVVGVVGSVRQVSLERDPWQDIYVPWTTNGQKGMDVIVRINHGPLAPIQAALSESRDGSPSPQVRSLEESVSQTVAGRRFVVWLLGAFAVMAAFLALVGVYGSLSYWVSTQVPALAIRTALGAVPRDLVAFVLGRCLRLATAGILMGLAASVVVALLVGSRLSGMRLVDPASYAVAVVGFWVLSAAAGIGPALWAAKVDPCVALKNE